MQSVSALSICKINKMSNNFAVIAKYRVIGKVQKMRAKIDEIVMQKLTDLVVLKTFTIWMIFEKSENILVICIFAENLQIHQLIIDKLKMI